MGLKAIVLAAGKGTRMKSDTLKVLHEVAGKPILSHVLDTVSAIAVDEVFLVVGHQSERVREEIDHPKVTFVEQIEQLGTGHAVMQVEPFLSANREDTVIVLAGDCPLIEPETLQHMLAIHAESNAAGTVLTTHMPEPGSYGRILRGKMGTVMGIKEAKDCSPSELKVTEINTGVYAFEVGALFDCLHRVGTNNSQQEYYLTDVIKLIKSSRGAVSAYCTEDPDQVVGINTRMDLAKINSIIYQRNNEKLMENGVTIIDPSTTFIDSTVTIGQDSIISPFTVLQGNTQVGTKCRIHPHCYLKDAILEDEAVVAPFTHVNGPVWE
jgi:bifunctional UDP-N-acetylglucosamine pyrophosphorylase/glucosamine-1-phosphate N-acetyltransferase